MPASGPLRVCAMAAWLWGAVHAQWSDLEVRLTMNCNAGRTFFPGLSRSCATYFRSDYKSVTVNGVSLMSIFGKDLQHWKRTYDWDPGAAAFDFYSDPSNGCRKDDTICREARVCEMVEETWGHHLVAGAATTLVQAGDPLEQQGSETRNCMICPPRPCTLDERSCPNGKVALMPGLLVADEKDSTGHGANYVYTKAVCSKSCSPGYWLTCLNDIQKMGCKYLVPDIKMTEFLASGKNHEPGVMDRDVAVATWIQQNRAAGGGVSPVAMLLKFGTLVDECYPCAYANGLSHYGEPLLLVDVKLTERGFLTFFCPGGADPPRLCPQGKVSKVDNITQTSGTCRCMDGYYDVGGGRCELCPAGFYCTFDGGKVACPSDTYAVAGATACVPCTSDSTRCGPTQALVRCIDGFQDKDAECIDCMNCRFPGSSSTGKPCQKVSQGVTAR